MRSGLKHLLIYRLTRSNQKCYMIAKSFMFSPVKMILNTTGVEFRRNDYYTDWQGARMSLVLAVPNLIIAFLEGSILEERARSSAFWCGTEKIGWTSYRNVDHPIVYELLLANEYMLIIDYCKKLAKID